ncbi:MAG: MFS transporter [Candidatus Muproteobacteria bacterium RIFCSPHIGHO2_12_FULL_60_33]|uniref:MFS transporter n=1 Tax=Candidatus Muproteobacteria bacterium RIFCSPLOWO2_01_FULL_60_18 TaxID=1817768 RepID=A0A1F6TYC8_9PROT|nr:MAG: MFS transporter [Candidatus Muproteobacteria bacterium RIFCSPLOWO2_01_FULL_60_18]OGI55158.1 MAG: MFS transporter [Candidatus Muproteobacteria bacterium RIFCSPHIGHO2_12_FULL_60_33]
MNWREFKQAGHWPTLLSAFLYFDVSFMAWVVLGPLSLYLTQDLGLTIEEKFSVVAIPILAGALLRVPLGMLADHLGPKLTGSLAQMVVIAGMAYAWIFGLHSKLEVELLGVVLGLAGASFAVALPQASRWYPPKYQGVVLGIAGAGNMGVVLDSLFVPWMAEHWGWQSVFGVLLIPLGIVLVLYMLMAKDAPETRAPVTLANYANVLRDRDTWWFMFFYSITFGGFVGLGNALPLYFTNWYHTSGIAAGLMAAMVVMAGSMARPIGGILADRFGGIRTLELLFVLVALAYMTVAMLPQGPAPVVVGDAKVAGWALAELPGIAWLAVAVFFLSATALGMGNGSVFQLVPLRFRNEIGVMTGLVGAAGGIGGFFLAKALGISKGMTGGFMGGFTVFAGLAVIGLFGLMAVKTRWRTTWGAVSGAQV